MDYFAQTTHKDTKDFKIQVLEFISLPQMSEQALKICLQKEKFWTYIDSDAEPYIRTEHHGVTTWGKGLLAKDSTLLYDHQD